MALSNRDRVGKGLEHLAEGLRPFVEQEMKAVYEDRWLYAAAESLRLESTKARDEQLRDVYALLRVMWTQWNNVFGRVLGRAERSNVSELIDVRNSWAHQEPFSVDDAYRALDTVQRLLTAVSSEEAIDVERLKQEVLRQRYERQAREAKKGAEQEALRGEPLAGLKPWREVVTPHKDVREGRYQMAEFMADLAQVHRGEGSTEYRDPGEFFGRTYITQGLRRLLGAALERLGGLDGDPVVELQTSFGGGKTHSLLALYHLFSGASASDLVGVEEILAETGVEEVPETCRAVLVGTALAPGQPNEKPDGTVANTLWGELAWQLGGREGYELVAEADRTATNPGSALVDLFRRYAPCLVLIDEWVAYARQLYGKQDLPGGSFDTHFTFAQTLTEAARAVPQVQVVISIPASSASGDQEEEDDEEEAGRSSIEIGGEGGRAALTRLRQVVGRVHSPWRPASKEESFAIVRRRLFEEHTDHVARDAVVRAFSELYGRQEEDFPSGCKEGEYAEKLKTAYPVHPELFDRLYDDWSTLEKFQRTRGVLRLVARVIFELWERDDAGLVILPGSVPIFADGVKSELTRYLEDNWTPVIDRDVDGEGSTPVLLERENQNLKRVSAARRVTRTVYLGSAPMQKAAQRGLDDRRINLGCCQPGESPAVFGDALRRLTDQATYLYFDANRYWFQPQPSIARTAKDRAEQLWAEADDVILERLRGEQRQRGSFSAVHPAPRSSADVPDEPDARLVILGPDTAHAAKMEESLARARAAEILTSRGDSPRRFRNSLVFLAPDSQRLEELREAAAHYLAWTSIGEDKEELSLDTFQVNQAESKMGQWDDTVNQRLRETYCWLLEPAQTDPQGSPEWRTHALRGTEALARRTSDRLEREGSLTARFGSPALRYELDRIPLWPDGQVSVRKLWEDFAQYLYLPRLRDVDVLLAAVQEGVAQLAWYQEGFAYAERYDEAKERYMGLRAGTQVGTDIDGLVVRPDVAQAQLERERAEREREAAAGAGVGAGAAGDDSAPGVGGAGGTGDPAGSDSSTVLAEPPHEPKVIRFYAQKKLDPLSPTGDVGSISENVIHHLSLLEDAKVEVTLEIQVKIPKGAPDHVVRTVTENCRTLGIEDQGFERE